MRRVIATKVSISAREAKDDEITISEYYSRAPPFAL